MIQKQKMSKKDRRKMDLKSRNLWTRNPVTRVKESAKNYNRSAKKRACRDY